MVRCDWLKGSHMTKVVWLQNETDCLYCEFVAKITSYYCYINHPKPHTIRHYILCLTKFVISSPINISRHKAHYTLHIDYINA